jgi:hypothetical protein
VNLLWFQDYRLRLRKSILIYGFSNVVMLLFRIPFVMHKQTVVVTEMITYLVICTYMSLLWIYTIVGFIYVSLARMSDVTSPFVLKNNKFPLFVHFCHTVLYAENGHFNRSM